MTVYIVMEHGKRSLFLHKDEWNRLKSIGAPPAPENRKTNEFIQSLIEKSQQWINAWPGSIQSHIVELEKQKRKQRVKDIDMIKKFKKEQKESYKKDKSIEKAKQLLFEDSCYGRRLISALLQSKTQEERDAQIEFQKKIKDSVITNDLNNNATGCFFQSSTDMESLEEREIRTRDKNKEVARVNKTIYLTDYENKKREKEKEKQIEIEDLRLITELNRKDTMQEDIEKMRIKKDFEEFRAEQKQIQDTKALRKKQEERKIEIWRKYEDRKNAIIKKIHEKHFEKIPSTKNYELVKKLNDDKQNRYDEFINKGITTLARKMQMKEDEDNHKRIEARKKQYLIVQSNKKLEEEKRIEETKKCLFACDKQCIIAKCKNYPPKKEIPTAQALCGIRQNSRQVECKDNVTFASLNNTLVKKLKIKEKEPSPWGSLAAAHTQFARQADRILQECTYKYAARKVIEDYRTLHALKPEDLCIPHNS